MTPYRLLPPLTPGAVERLRALGDGERDLFTGDSSDPAAYAMSLRHLKAYEYVAAKLPRGRVLELGCGAGSGAVFLRQAGADVVAADVDAKLTRLLPELWPESGVRWLACSGSGLPFRADSFDVVVSFQVLEHLREPEIFLQDALRILRPGGRLILTTPNRTLRVAPGQSPWNPYHVREFWPWTLERLLAHAGFTEVQMFGLQGRHPWVTAERNRTMLAMMLSLWGRLPAGLRLWVQQWRRPAISSASLALTSHPASAIAADWPGPEIYSWSKNRLWWSLDLLAAATKRG